MSKPKRFTPAQIERMQALKREGWGLKHIAGEFKISVTYASMLVRFGCIPYESQRR